MTLLKEIPDKICRMVWSPCKSQPHLLALGAKEGSGCGFDDTGGDLSIHSVPFNDGGYTAPLRGSIQTRSLFSSLDWADIPNKNLDCGIIAGGMRDGVINIFDPSKIMQGDDVPEGEKLISTIVRHQAAVTALQFNPHSSSRHLLASGGADQEVCIVTLDRPGEPSVFSPTDAGGKHNGEVSCVAWNTQVPHILAAGAQSGSTMIWDLKSKRLWCELRDPYRSPVSAVAWNPQEGLHIITASEADGRPLIQLWDLRSSTTNCLAELSGHTKGILDLAWCPFDNGLLMSCGKDNRTLLWDLFSPEGPKIIQELASSAQTTAAPQMAAMNVFASASMTGSGRRYCVDWSPQIPAVLATCSLDRKVQVHGMVGAGSPESRPPSWLSRPCGATFGFGGKLVSFHPPAPPGPSGVPNPRLASISRVLVEPDIVRQSQEFEAAMASGDFKGFCTMKAQMSTDSHEKSLWSFMEVLFDTDARSKLLAHLGFSAEAIAEEVKQALGTKTEPEPATGPLSNPESTVPATGSAEDVFAAPATASANPEAVFNAPPAEQTTTESTAAETEASAAVGAISLSDPSTTAAAMVPGQYQEIINCDPAVEELIKKALLVGNFEAAVDCCLRYNRLADAVLLATCGGQDLWTRTQEAYFQRQRNRPFMRTVASIIKSELSTLVEEADLEKWQETLAILSTYAKSEEFPGYCGKLGERLEKETRNLEAATLCYLCAVNVKKTVAIWVAKANQESQPHRRNAALQSLIEKVTVFRKALGSNGDELEPEMVQKYVEYASLLASQGQLEIGSRYLKMAGKQDWECQVLEDRLFHAGPFVQGSVPPPNPFTAIAQQQASQLQTQTAAQPTVSQTGQSQYSGNATSYSQPSAAGSYSQPAASNSAYGQQSSTPAYAQQGQGGNSWGTAPQVPTQAQQQQQPVGNYQQQPGRGYQQQQAGGGYDQQEPINGYGHQQQHSAGNTWGGNASQNSNEQTKMYSQPQRAGNGQQTANAGYNQTQPAGQVYAQSQQQPTQPQVFTPNAHATPAPTGGASGKAPDLSKLPKDGFVSSARGGYNSELQQKYSHHGAAPVGQEKPAETSVSRPSGDTSQIQPELLTVVQALTQLKTTLEGMGLSGMEKKQMAEASKAVLVLSDKLNARSVSESVCSSLKEIGQFIAGNNYDECANINRKLIEEEWNQHKDWLKGFKGLFMLAKKRLR